jgi:hypothetical protein
MQFKLKYIGLPILSSINRANFQFFEKIIMP